MSETIESIPDENGGSREHQYAKILPTSSLRKHTRHNRKNKTHRKNVIIVGKVYADWCGHCQMLKPEWAKMKKHMHSIKGNKRILFVEVEEKQIESKLRQLEKDQNVTIQTDGYPTLFKIDNGKVQYYNGDRQSSAMTNWYLRGGDAVNNASDSSRDIQLPGLLQDQQGGRHRTFKKRQHSKKKQQTQYHRNRIFEKSRLFELLFGKK